MRIPSAAAQKATTVRSGVHAAGADFCLGQIPARHKQTGSKTSSPTCGAAAIQTGRVAGGVRNDEASTAGEWSEPVTVNPASYRMFNEKASAFIFAPR
jgi:hypothetical protein